VAIHVEAALAKTSLKVAAHRLDILSCRTIAQQMQLGITRGVQTKEPPHGWSGSPSSQAIPITRPFAPHLVALDENSNP
jgi:hypothetical protein